MLIWILIALFLILFVSSIFIIISWMDKRKNEGKKNLKVSLFLVTTFLLFFLFTIWGCSIMKKYTSNPTISFIPITEVYKGSSDSEYVIKDENGDVYSITAYTIYKGDANMIIHYHYPNMTKKAEELLIEKSNKFDLIVTDPESIVSTPTLLD